VGVNVASRFSRTPGKTDRERKLRRDATDVENLLWRKLRNAQIEGASFRRQHTAGRYVLDFYCPALQLGVELDGGQHAHEIERDRKRDQWLTERGVTVLRFWNSDLTENLTGVIGTIAAKIFELKSAKLTPTRRWRADLPLSGGGKQSARHH
jgi:very-short-patch-repair endonuclease